MSDSPESLDDVIALERLLSHGVRLRNVDIEWSDETRSAVTIRGELPRAILDAIKAEIRAEAAESTRRSDALAEAYLVIASALASYRTQGLNSALAIIERHEAANEKIAGHPEGQPGGKE